MIRVRRRLAAACAALAAGCLVAPAGTTRGQRERCVGSRHLDVAAFDYPESDPRQGTVIVAKAATLPWARDVCVLFRLDRRGERGRVISTTVSAAQEEGAPHPP